MGLTIAALGSGAALVAVIVSVFQVYRDRNRERRQAIATAQTAKLLIGAAYASSIREIRNLQGMLGGYRAGSPFSVLPVKEAALRLRDDRQLAIIFQALLSIDATSLDVPALKPVGDAQAALIALRNVIGDLATHPINGHEAERLKSLTASLRSAFERMRGNVPFELDS